jgi:phosphoribosylanthranilate isomerase
MSELRHPKTRIKVCGIKNNRLFHSFQHVEIDLIGFVFAPSTRQVTAEQANEMIEELSSLLQPPPLFTGVFRNTDEHQLATILSAVPLDVVQFHGEETVELCRHVKKHFNKRVMKVFSLENGTSSHEIIEQARAYLGTIDMMLIDTFDSTYGGGSGKTFRWEVIYDIQQWCEQHQLPLFVAGGLNVENVGTLIETYHPAGIDVSSGVETDGEKDLQKITNFIERVRIYDYST